MNHGNMPFHTLSSIPCTFYARHPTQSWKEICDLAKVFSAEMERIGQRASRYSFLHATIGQTLLLESGIIRRTRIWTRDVEQTWMKDIERQGASAETPRCWFPSAATNHLQRYYPQLQKREDLSASQQLNLQTPPSSPTPSLSYRILP